MLACCTVIRKRPSPVCAVDVSGKRLGRGAGCYDRALARVGGHRIGMIVHRLAGPIVPHGDVKPGRAAGRAARHRERDKRLIGAVLLGDLGERRGVTGPRFGSVDHGYI